MFSGNSKGESTTVLGGGQLYLFQVKVKNVIIKVQIWALLHCVEGVTPNRGSPHAFRREEWQRRHIFFKRQIMKSSFSVSTISFSDREFLYDGSGGWGGQLANPSPD